MSDTAVHTLRTMARTPWGFTGLAQTTLPKIDPIALEEARRNNLRVVQNRLVPSIGFPGHSIRRPVADTTVTVSETLVTQDLMGDDEDHLDRFEEYEIEFWRMGS